MDVIKTRKEIILERKLLLIEQGIIPKTRVCSKCNIEKEHTEFNLRYRPLSDTVELYCHCKECVKEYNLNKVKQPLTEEQKLQKLETYKKWYQNTKDIARKRVNLREYGITPEEHEALFIQQKFCCAICGTHQSELSKALCVDHDHLTGEVRGLLCNCCNMVLGKFDDNISLFEKAIEYLKKTYE